MNVRRQHTGPNKPDVLHLGERKHYLPPRMVGGKSVTPPQKGHAEKNLHMQEKKSRSLSKKGNKQTPLVKEATQKSLNRRRSGHTESSGTFPEGMVFSFVGELWKSRKNLWGKKRKRWV